MTEDDKDWKDPEEKVPPPPPPAAPPRDPSIQGEFAREEPWLSRGSMLDEEEIDEETTEKPPEEPVPPEPEDSRPWEQNWFEGLESIAGDKLPPDLTGIDVRMKLPEEVLCLENPQTLDFNENSGTWDVLGPPIFRRWMLPAAIVELEEVEYGEDIYYVLTVEFSTQHFKWRAQRLNFGRSERHAIQAAEKIVSKISKWPLL